MGFQEAGLAEAGREKAGLAEKISGSKREEEEEEGESGGEKFYYLI